MRLAVTIQFSLAPPVLLFAGALLAVIAALCVIVFILAGDCGSNFSYYGCETPSSTARPVAPRL